MAEKVLKLDPMNVMATYAKAESLYYTCEFEHAMLTYYRGLVSLAFS